MIYYILLFLIFVFLIYITCITFLTIVDKRLEDIKIKLPKQDIVVNIPDRNFSEKFNTKKENDIQLNTEHLVEGFDNKYIINNKSPKIEMPIENICYKNHGHNACIHGRMNYPDPHYMSPIDKKYYKYNYQPNMRLQDYISWLWMYNDNEEDMPYIHLKNLIRLKKGDKLQFQPGILPPVGNTMIPKSSEDYFNIMYNTGDININAPLDTSDKDYDAFNYNQYPSVQKKLIKKELNEKK